MRNEACITGGEPTIQRVAKVIASCGAFMLIQPHDAAASGAPEPPTSVTLLPSLPDTRHCEAFDLNDTGAIVGMCLQDGPFSVPVRWLNESAIEKLDGPLHVTTANGSTVELPIAGGVATGINSSGQVSGLIQHLADGFIRARAAVWEEGIWRDLGPEEARNAGADDIDDEGRVVGRAVSSAVTYAVAWSGNVIVQLPLLEAGTFCRAFATNESGEIVGHCNYEPFGKLVPVLWKKGRVFELLNTREQGVDFARTINEVGLIGGTAMQSARVWYASKLGKSELIAATGTVNSINDRGVMVGFLGINGDPESPPQAAWWRNAGQLPVLMLPGYSMSFPRAINLSGVVVGLVETEDGGIRAFVAR